MRARLAFALLLAAALLSGAAALDFTRGARAREDGPAAAAAPAGRAARLKALDDYGRAPMGFEANTGQVEGPVDFVAQGIGYTLFLTPSEAVFALRSAETKPDGKKAAATAGDARAEHPVAAEGAGYRVLRMKLVGASAPSEVSGEGIQPGRRNYFVGGDPARWRTNVPVYSKARYAGVYRGVDLVYYGNQRQLEYDFEVAPGADARPIRLKFEGADAAKIDDESGDLLLTLAGAELVMRRPFIYQPGEGGERREVEGRYTLRGRNSVGFEVGSYDRTKPLIIDPVLNYSTYLGTSSADYTNGIAVDSAGNAYVTGATDSLSFPTTGQTFVSPNSFFGQAFVTKLNPAGTALAYSTVVGGSDSDGANAIAVDSSGAAYVTGRTYSRDFPLVAPLKSKGPFFRTANSAASWDNRATGFEPHVQIVQSVAVSPSSPSILYAGGSGGLHKSTDGGATWQKLAAAGVTFPTFGTLAVHPSNPSVIYTANNNATFRSTDGGATFTEVPLTAFGAAARCVEFDPTNSSVIYLCISSGVYKSTDDGATWSLLNSGLTNSNVLSLAVDPQTTTTLYAGTFGGGVFKSTNGGASWSPANNGVSPLSTRNVSAIAVDPSSPSTLYFGTSYATGSGEIYKSTDGAGLWAPLTNGVPKDNGISDIVIDRTTTSTIYAATTGGGVLKTTNGGDSWAPANAGLWNPVVTSLAADPTDSSKLYAGTQGGARTESDAFALKLSPAGDALAYSTYVGGSADDEGRAVAVDSAGNAYLSGQTSSGNFPLASPVQSELRGPADAFVTKINAAGDAYVFSTYFGGAGLDGARAVATDSAGNAYAAGNTSSSDLQTTPGAFQTTAPGAGFTTSLNEGADAFVLKVAAAGSGVAYATYLGGAQGGEGANGIAVDSAGSAHVVGSTSSNNFPAQNPLRPFGGADGFIAKLNAAGSALVYSSPLGGSGDDAAAAVALDAAGAAHVTGWTRSLDFPSTGGHLKSRSNLFRSVDAAATWRNDNNGVSAALVFDIEVDPTAPHVIYVGTSSGVFKSTNGGRAWSPSNNGLANRNVRFIAVNPKSPSTVYAGTIFDGSNQGGLYKSTDGGASWAKTPNSASNGESFFDVYALALDPVAPDTIYLHSGFRTFKSTTGGASWDGANNGLPSGATSFAVDPSNTQVVYASVNTSEGGVFKTTDGGANWSKTSNGLTTTFVHRVVVSPQTPSTVYATSIFGVHKSVDGGAGWATSLANGFAGDIVVDPQNNSNAYVIATVGASAGTIYKTTDGGAMWRKSGAGLLGQLAALGIDPLTPSNLYTASNVFGLVDADAFVLKLNAAGTALEYSTPLGGTAGGGSDGGAHDYGTGIAVDSSGAAYVSGWTLSIDFPVSSQEVYQVANRGNYEGFIAKLSPSLRIAGRVADAQGNAQAGVKVTLSGSLVSFTTTGADGLYEFDGLAAGGSYTVSATKAGFAFAPPSQTFDNLSANQALDFTASASGAAFFQISGRVTEAGTGLALPGARVALAGSQIEFATTDGEGRYSFTAPGGGSYTLTASSLGFAFAGGPVSIANLSADQTADFAGARQTLVVTNTNDHGAGSLRQAILDANSMAGADRITFNIPGSGVRTISPVSPLPEITGTVELDATTQPGFAGTPVVELSGAQAGGGGAAGLTVAASNCLVRGFVINRFNGANGIRIAAGEGSRVEGNYIGTDAAGEAARPNHTGVAIGIASNNNRIGGPAPSQRNVISGNTFGGVTIASAGNRVQGNFIGTNAAGTTPLGNGGDGIEIGGSPGAPPINNIIGGTEPGARNVISGQGNTGVDLGGSAAGTLIQGNFIGTDVTGTVAISNGVGVNLSANTATVGGTAPAARNVISGNGKGINISTFSGDPHNQILGNYIGVDAAGTTALANGIGIEVNGSNAVIGGTEFGSGNVISGNLVGVDCRLGSGTRILGNLIGTDASGNLAVGNQLGVALSSNQNRVGGPEAGARNVISGNLTGVDIGSLTTGGPSGNRIQGNLIGTNAAGTTALGNTLQGVRITQAANNIVGGAGTGEGNTIAFNGWGVSVSQFAATGNRIRGNSVFSNALLGIDLNNDLAVNPNDPLDADAGANMLQNFPVLGAVTASAGTTRVVGTLRSTPGTEFTVDFYANAACDPSGNGEGARPFGSAQVVTDAAGEAAFDVTLPQGLPAGRALTATATDPAGNTSEFSPCAASRASGSVEFSSARYDVLEDVGQAVIRVVRTGGSRGTLTVNYSSGGGTATAGADYTPASGTLTFAEGETEKILNVPIADDGATEPEETVNLTLSGVPELESLGSRPAAVLHIFDSTTPLTIRGGDPAEHGRLLITEGTGGRRNAVVPVSLSAATSRTVTVDYATVGSAGPGGATAGSDFLSVSGTITFEPGSQFKQVVVPVIGDAFDEFEESFSVSFTNPSGASVNNFALVTIVDDDAEPSILVPDVAAAESAAGSKATFSVRLSAVSGKTVSVGYSTADGTASAGSDYTAASSFLTFSPGETVKNVEVTVLADAAAEGDETFTLNLSNPFNATRADSQATATILDSASATPVVRFTNPSYTASESAHTVSIGVTRTGDTSGESTVRYETLGQRASERTDFTRGGGTLRFAPGETAKTFDVLITDDRYSEPVESLNLILSSPTGAALGGPSAVFVTITSDDASDAPSPVRESSFDTQFFVRQHYHDFLNREPDAGGLAFWSNEIEKCGADAQCREVRKINVSAAFFLSIEFQETGYLVYRMYKSAFGDATSPGVAGTVPVVRLEEFLPDTQRIGQGVVVGRPGWPELLEANKQAFAQEFVSRQRFLDAYPLTMSPAEFVDKLNEQAGGVLSQEERDALVAELAANNTGAGRASALRRVAEDEDLRRREFNRAFVLMQYYGYLRRNPDDAPDTNFGGWKFWLTKLDEFNGNFIDAQMVKAFIDSIEYTERFGR